MLRVSKHSVAFRFGLRKQLTNDHRPLAARPIDLAARFPLETFCKGIIRATGWCRSNTKIDSPRFTRSRYRVKFFFNSVIPTFFMSHPARHAVPLLIRNLSTQHS